MFLGYKRFFILVFKTFFHPKDSYARWTPKRFIIMMLAIPALGFGQLVHWIGFLLDDLLFRGWRNVEVEAPVFVVGVPRSGTTLLQRVLARDTANFTGVTLWEMALAPSITERKCLALLGTVDRLFGGFGLRLVKVIDRRMFGELSKIHPTSLFDHEEDELLLFPIFASAILIYPFPFPEELEHLARFDEQVSEKERRRVMSFYKSCIKRHLYVHGTGKRYMTKNTLSTSKIEAIRECFPDARIICNVRSPHNSIPSIMSLASFFWNQFDDGGDMIEFRDQFMGIARHLYTHPMEVLPNLPEDRYAIVRYDDLKQDVPQTVTDLYDRLAIPLGPAFAQCLKEEGEKSKNFKSKHAYSMEEYAITPELIREHYAPVFDCYSFPAVD